MAQITRVQSSADFHMEAAGAAPESLEVLQQNLTNAEKAYTVGLSKRDQLSKARNNLNQRIAGLNRTLRVKRVESYEAAANEHPANHEALCKEIRVLAQQRDDAVAALSYITSFSLSAAETALLQAEADEREATAKLLTAQALDARKASLEAAQAAKKIDPGISMNFANAKSQRLLEQANSAQYQSDRIKESLAQHKAAAAAEQQLVAPGLING